MASAPKFDLLLYGYRNDLARERSIAFLRRLGESGRLNPSFDRDTVLPSRVLVEIDHDLGLKLCAELRRLGAQVRLVAADPVSVAPSPPQRAPMRMGWLVTGSLVVAAAALYLRTPSGLVQLRQQVTDFLATDGNPPASVRLDKALMPDGPEPETYALNNAAIELSQAGDYSGAAQRLREALKSAPNDPTLRRNFQALMQQWAVTELNGGRPEVAVDIAQSGLELGEEPFLLQVLGFAHARNQEPVPARQALERAVQLGVKDPSTFITLGRLYRQLGERERAAAMFQLARENGAKGPEFERVLQQVERELDAEWDFSELTSPHFVISFAQGENYTAARLVMAGLEDAYPRDGRLLDFYPQERVQVVLYTAEEFHDITQAPSWMGALYDGRIKLPVRGLETDTAVLDRTLRHEYAHVIVSQLSHNRCPVWLSEGIALWAEEDREGDKLSWAQATIAGKPLFHLRDLEGKFTGLPADRVRVAYAQSYLAVQAMLAEYGPRGVRELLTALGTAGDFPSAFTEAFRSDFAGFEDHLLRDLTG